MDPRIQARLVALLGGGCTDIGWFYHCTAMRTSGIIHIRPPASLSVISLFPLFYSVTDPDTRLQALWVVCDKLPKNNKTNLRLV